LEICGDHEVCTAPPRSLPLSPSSSLPRSTWPWY